MKKVLFLDLNGTSVDDWDLSYAGVKAIFGAYKKPVPSIEEYVSAVASDGGYLQFYLDRGINATRDNLYTIFTPAYHALMKELRVTPGLHTTLRILKDAGVEIHLISAGQKDFAEPLVTRASLQGYCESMHFHVHDKAAQVKAIIQGMDYIKPHECAMIGDLPSDMLDSKRAGINGVAFLNKHVPRELFTNIEMDFAVIEFEGILPFMLER